MRKTRLLVIAAIAVLAGCAFQQPLLISSTSLGAENEEVVGMATGSAYKFYIPVLAPLAPLGIGDDSFKAALEDALDGTKAHTLVNIFADRQCIFFPHPMFYLVARCENRVTGTAIRYRDLPANSYFEALGRPYVSTSERSYGQLPPSPEGIYRRLLPMDGGQAKALLDDLDYKRLKRLRMFLLSRKGKGSRVNRTYTLRSGLPKDEEEFLRWFIPNYTNYTRVKEGR